MYRCRQEDDEAESCYLPSLAIQDRSRQALEAPPELFGRPEGEGVGIAVRATERLMLGAEVVEALVALTHELRSVLNLP